MNEKEFIKAWQKNVKDNRIHELFTIDEYDLWDFFEPLVLGNSRLNIFFDFPQFPKIIKSKNEQNEKASLKSRIISPSFLVLYLKLRSKLRGFLIKRRNNKRQDIIFLSSERFDRNNYENHQIFGEIFRLLNKENIEFKLIKFDLFYKFPKILQVDSKSAFIGQYYSKKIRKEILLLEKKIKIKLNEISKENNWKKLFKINKKNFLPPLNNQIIFFFKSMPFYIAEILCITKEILRIEKPKTVVLVSEADFYSKGIIQNARKTKTVALQFGIIPEGLSDIPPTNRSFPSIKCVTGLISKKNLVEFYNYPERIIKVTGEPRYDSLINNNWNNKEIYKKLNLDRNKKIILFIDEGNSIKNIATKISNSLLKLMKEIPKIQIIVKIHPNDKNSLPIYQSILSKKEDIKIIDNFNISKLIYFSDIIIALNSTAILEALVNKKPTILLNFNNLFPNSIYKNAKFVNNERELVNVVKGAIQKKEEFRKLIKITEKLSKMHTNNEDGNATKRVIENIINK